MKNEELRLLVINTLDDEHGVNEIAYKSIEALCDEQGWIDIIEAVRSSNGRHYLDEDVSEDLRVI
jgi:hypothetical protein